MKCQGIKNPVNKTILSRAISTAFAVGIGLGTTTANADIYEFSFANGGCVPDPGPGTTCTGPGDAVFTMLDPTNILFTNKAYPYYGDTTWGYGSRTQIGGSVVFDETQGTGTIAINDFDFVPASGAAVAHDITIEDIGDGLGGSGTLWLGNLLFDWSGNNGIPVSIVWDLQGILGALSGLNVNNIPDVGNQVSGVGAVPASNDVTSKLSGPIPIGPAPIATTTFNTTPVSLPAGDIPPGTTPSGIEPIIADGTNIGGSPMPTVPFRDHNANFDFTKLTLAGYNDTTAPVLTLNGAGTATVNLTVGDAFDVNSPGISVTCLDNADGSDSLTDAVGTNANISFTVDNGNGGATPPVDTNTADTYEVLYTCTDKASARTALSDDPNNPGNPTNPTLAGDNTSANTTVLTVNVAGVGQPVITITNSPTTAHEACTTYTDAGATWNDPEDGGPFAVTDITDVTPIIGTAPNEGTHSIEYNAEDSNMNAATTQTRTVNVTDTLPPTINITGGAAVSIESSQASTYTNPNATAVDANGNCNPASGGVATTTDTVNFVVPANQDTLNSTLRYFASDTAAIPNQRQTNQVVTVTRSEPVITLIGAASVVVKVGDVYTEQGMDIHDVQDGDLTAVTTTGTTTGVGAGSGNIIHNIVIRDASSATVSSIDTSVGGGRYTVIYDVTDSDTNTATQVIREVSIGVFADNSNFTMLEKTGKTFGGTNDVVFDWDESLNTLATDTNFNMKISTATPTPFNGAVWIAHDIRAFGEGTYYIETDNSVCSVSVLQATGCPGTEGSPTSMKMIVGPNQVGAHILFDWNSVENIDVVNVWDKDAVWDDYGAAAPRNAMFLGPNGVAPSVVDPWKLVSTAQFTDSNGPVHGSPMIDGPFKGFYANFNAGPGGVGVALPKITTESSDTSLGASSMSLWTLITGLLSLFGLRVAGRRFIGKL